MEQENLFRKIQDILGDFKGNLNILEEQIDLNIQVEYYEASKAIKDKVDADQILARKDSLFSSDTSLDEKKILLNSLASIDKTEAFRILEQYHQAPEPELKEWATLAFQESKLLMESSILEENQIVISTGMGGKGHKLRYFIVLLANESSTIDDLQLKIIETELAFLSKKCEAELEEINHSDRFVTIKILISMEVNLYDLFEELVDNCNQFGDFLQQNFIITNVKALTFEEIEHFLETSHLPGESDSEL
ncbi:MAG: hypothetical protein Q8928_03020 [Bacteroidota bacterium]|nr:hypothetical protein [Bacteroidota bacterium]